MKGISRSQYKNIDCCFINLSLSMCSQALDLKPSYVRAWANMGISYANQVITIYVLFTRSGHCKFSLP